MADIHAVLTPYRELLKEVDDWFARCSLAVGDQISCRRGCSACCRGLFDITLLDAFVLKDGFERLDNPLQQAVIARVQPRIEAIQALWPDFTTPFVLNLHPEDEWESIMPDEDETPCPLLDDDGRCLVYESRPMTCRLHGIPMVELSGEVLFDEWCSENFTDCDPLKIESLRAPFNELFTQEQLLFREFTRRLVGTPFNELDTVIPAAPLIDFNQFMLPEQLHLSLARS